MNLRKTIYVTAVAVWLFWPAVAVGGPWIPDSGDGYLKLSGSYFESTGMRNVAGESIEPNFDYSHKAVRLYSDVGISPHLGFSVSVPFLSSQNAERGSPTIYKKSGFGDLDLSLQFGREFGQLALSATIDGRIPLYAETISNDTPVPSTISEFQTRYVPALGDGSYDVSPKIQIGYSLHPFPGWISGYVGPKFRFNRFGNGIEYAANVGAFVVPKSLAIKGRVGGIQRLSDDNERPTKSYIQVSGGIIVPFTEVLSVESTGAYIPTGQFVSEGWSVNAGISYKGDLF